MVEHAHSIRRFLERLVRRERGLLLLEIAGRSAVVLGLAGLVAVLAVPLGLPRGVAASSLALVLGVGFWVAAVHPLLTRWRAAGDLLRQARMVERVRPDLRGRLVTTAERLHALHPGESAVLLGRIARRAWVGCRDLPPRAVHGAFRAAVAQALALVALTAPLPFALVTGPGAVWSWWAAGIDGANALAALHLDADPEAATVGDFVLRYTYPAYTGLDPRVVENSTGDINGPPGTIVQIHARSAVPLEAAGLIAYGQRYEAHLLDPRTVEARVTIEDEDGTYSLVTWHQGEERASRELKIIHEDDLPPTVTLDGIEPVVELAEDEPFELLWRARDDYGVTVVRLEIDGKPHRPPLYRAGERRAEVFDRLIRTPLDLGLHAGSQVKLRLAALDNDTLHGPKVGRSRTVELIVLGAKGLDQRREIAIQAMIDAMLTVLADHLEESAPTGPTQRALTRWAEQVAHRYDPLEEQVETAWSRFEEGSLERTVLTEVLETGTALVRFAVITFDSGDDSPPVADDLATLERYRQDAIVALEDGILALDRTLRLRALADVVELAGRLADMGRELDALLANDTVDSLQLLARLEQLEALMDELAKTAAKLDEGGLKEFLNARHTEAEALMESIRDAIGRGDQEEAAALMKRLSRQLQQLAEGVRDTLERQKGEGSQAMQQARQVVEAMERLEQAQRDLQEEVRQLRASADEEAARQAAALWERIIAESEALSEELEGYAEALERGGHGFSEAQRAHHAVQNALQLRGAARSMDYRGALLAHDALGYAMDSLRRARYAPGARGDRPPFAPMKKRYERIGELLGELERSASSSGSTAQAQALQRRQRELGQELESLREEAEKLAQEFPVRPKDMTERLREAATRMEQASDDLGRGRPMPAEGSQGAAADRLREARDALERAMEQAASQQRQLDGGNRGGGRGEGREESRGEHGGRDLSAPQEVEIPGVEAFRTPEEYRRALLEGMEGEVPEAYRALKKRYFEELVRQ